jgi:type IV secretion system protein VirB10
MSDNNDIPPPPPAPGESYNPGESFAGDNYGHDQQMDSGKPAVAASPSRVFTVLGIMGVVLIFLLYNIFFAGKSSEEKKDLQPSKVAERDAQIAPPAPPPTLQAETLPVAPPIAPPEIPAPTQTPEINQKEDEANNKALLDRLKSNMLIMNGGSSLFGGKDNNSEDQLAALDPNAQFGSLVVRSNTKAAKVTATHIGNLNRIIAQGRLIQATLETAINTDLPGPIRAIVSRDIYGEAGESPLIPKGSRLIGQYNSNIIAGQSRVYVMWTRVIRPDGVDVAIGSPLIDQIGQAGTGGFVDNKFREMFSRAVLASVFSIAVAYGVENISDDNTQTNTSSPTTGFFSQSGGTASSTTVSSLNRLGSTTASFISRFVNIKPTILVDQGSNVMVFVNRDLIFPSEYVGAQNVQ